MLKFLASAAVLAFVFACGQALAVEQLAYFQADSLEGVVDPALVRVDAKISHDGKGSLRIETEGATTVQLYSAGDIEAENVRLVYQAALRSKELQGQAYLEMLCQFKELGTYFSRALHAPISGDSDWVLQETPFFLQAGQNPSEVQLNLVITGPGTVWVDAVRLLRLPLQ